MTDLEFINEEIEKLKAFLELDDVLCELSDNDYKLYNDRLQIFKQIKIKLEAWEVVKKCLSISIDSWDEYSKSFEFISFTVAGIHPLLGFDLQEIESVKKALEVQDESRDY